MKSRGFTIVELLVTIAISSILVVAAVGMYLTVLGQAPLIKARNSLSTNLQSALNRINDDVRRSSNVTVYNLVPDANAPTTKTGYENVPGPDPDTNDQHFWRMSENRLLLNQTPVNASSDPIYDNAAYAVGQKNVIVYYIRDGALYRRTVAAPYGTNAATTATCARVAAGGCANADIKIVDNLKASLGNAAFKIVYYDRNGNEIKNTVKDTDGNDIPNYDGFPLTRSIGVTLELESGEVVGSQKVALTNTMRMQFRSQMNLVPPTVVDPPYVPPTSGLNDPGLMVGPGGLVVNGGKVLGGSAYVKGKVHVGFSSFIGGDYFPPLPRAAVPVKLNVANIGCGSGASYPVPCGNSSPPITIHNSSFSWIDGTVCAKDQTDGSRIVTRSGGQGLIAGCVPPETDLPLFNKSEHVANMTNGTQPGTAASCNNGSTTFQANRIYTGNVSTNFYCNVTINGSVYITGDLTANSGVQMRVAESVGTSRPYIIVNGKIDLNGVTIRPNSYGTAPYFISFFSADSACSASPSCTSIAPEKLKETLDTYTSTIIPGFLSNSVVTLHNVKAPGSSFYSYFGETYVNFFSEPGAISGQRVLIGGSVTIRMDAKL